jgi:protein HIRA/HIR1
MQQTQWLDFLPSPAIGVTVTKKFCAAAMQDGCINVYTPTGRRYGLRDPLDAFTNFSQDDANDDPRGRVRSSLQLL